VDNIKMDLRETGYENRTSSDWHLFGSGVSLIQTEFRNSGWDLVNTVMKHRVSYKQGTS
jgi:hypothetical protein